MGDILVGFLERPYSFEADEQIESVVLKEERSGTMISVSLTSPQLSALFELHNPRKQERIGIKCVGKDPDGTNRFIMIIDREPVNTDTPQESVTAEQTLYADGEEEPSSDCPAAEGPRIMGVLQQQEDELKKQESALKRLEAVVTTATAKTPAEEMELTFWQEPRDTCGILGTPPKGRNRRVRAALIALALAASIAGGAILALVYQPSLWLR